MKKGPRKVVRFREKVQVRIIPLEGINQRSSLLPFIVFERPITDENELANRNSEFRAKRIKMKAAMHLRHLQRKARRAARKFKRTASATLSNYESHGLHQNSQAKRFRQPRQISSGQGESRNRSGIHI